MVSHSRIRLGQFELTLVVRLLDCRLRVRLIAGRLFFPQTRQLRVKGLLASRELKAELNSRKPVASLFSSLHFLAHIGTSSASKSISSSIPLDPMLDSQARLTRSVASEANSIARLVRLVALVHPQRPVVASEQDAPLGAESLEVVAPGWVRLLPLVIVVSFSMEI